METFLHVLMAAVAGFGIAIVLVEKKEQWPATMIRPIISTPLKFVYRKLPEMLECSVCTSFWTSIACHIYLSFFNPISHLYYAPISGFIGLAITWSFIEMMNAIDPK